jgi:S-DNA-T family DNA segregation ATPase FtsK/SpoIIIE
MLSGEQRREILALGLLALALFLLLALIPVEYLGAGTLELFPSGNTMGVLGGTLRSMMVAAVGVASIMIPLLVALGGLRVAEWVDSEWVLRMAALGAGLLILVPPATWVVGFMPELAGWWGGRVGELLVSAIGWLGALILLVFLLLALSVGTLGWNPLRGLVQGVRAVSAGARNAWAVMADGMRAGVSLLQERWRAWAEKRRARAEARPEPAAAGSTPEDQTEPAPEPPAAEEPEPVPAAVPSLPDGAPPEVGIPPLELLTEPETRSRAGMERELERLGHVLVEKLATFNVQCELGGHTTGPVVTQFEVVPAPGVKVGKIANLDADLALAMKAKSIRIVAPIPGKGAVGVEMPNPKPEVVNLREILEARAYQSSKALLPLALGKDLTGEPFVADLARMPHVLIAGATGSGKSVCLNTVITSLVYRHTPATLRLLLIDPKMVELSTYADLPHLRHPVVTDPHDASVVLKWAALEMERRYALLSENGVRSIGEFNRRVAKGTTLRRVEPEGPEGDPDRWVYTDGVLPFIVVVVDELADLMMTVQGEVERPLTLLAQKARAIGIHLIVATQRPSVNVITGLIKANFPSRIAFRVASKTDSRTILDQNGADALLGNGDMLFLPPGTSEPIRIQGAYIPTEDTDRLTHWFGSHAARVAEEAEAEATREEPDILELVRSHEMEEAAEAAHESAGDWDELFQAAAEICIQQQGGSTSLLQRKLRIGYGRAARIVDQLHEAGVLGPPDGSKPREVLIGLDGLQLLIAGRDAESLPPL